MFLRPFAFFIALGGKRGGRGPLGRGGRRPFWSVGGRGRLKGRGEGVGERNCPKPVFPPGGGKRFPLSPFLISVSRRCISFPPGGSQLKFCGLPNLPPLGYPLWGKNGFWEAPKGAVGGAPPPKISPGEGIFFFKPQKYENPREKVKSKI